MEAITTPCAVGVLPAVGADDTNSHDGWLVTNNAPAVAGSVLHHDIARRQCHLSAVVDLEDQVAREKNSEVRRVGAVHPGVVARVHLRSWLPGNSALSRLPRQTQPPSTPRTHQPPGAP